MIAKNVIIKRMKTYWKSIEEKNDQLPLDIDKGVKIVQKNSIENMIDEVSYEHSVSRRDFLKATGFSITAATLAASCEAPINKAIPFVIKPEEVTSGIANYYASSFIDGSEYCSILVKTREGRPIKIEGNELSSITKGGTNARTQASILSLYDSERLRGALHKQNPTTWEKIDENVSHLLRSFNEQDGQIAILSSSIISPSTKNVYADFVKTYPNTRIVYYDAVSASAMLEANEDSFDQRVIPSYRIDKADIIVSFGADFLGTWLSPIEFTKQYVKNRKLDDKKTMSRHIQFETGMSLTGSNADTRFPIRPSEEGTILTNLYNQLIKLSSSTDFDELTSSVNVEKIALELWDNKGKSLVLSGSNDTSIQILVNAINVLLENYRNTIDLNTPLYLKQGIDKEMVTLVKDMNEGVIDALIINNVNPVYDYPEADEFVSGLKQLKLTVSLSSTLDETSSLVNYVCPDNHYLESWNDAEAKKDHFSLCQPTISRLFDTRAAQESLLRWMGNETDFHDYIQQYWKEGIYPLHKKFTDKDSEFSDFWIKSLQDGIFEVDRTENTKIQHEFNASIIKPTINKLINASEITNGFELQIYEHLAVGNGKHANNPWLQELPDPITKVCWDNHASISPGYASEMELKNGDVVTISSNTEKIEIPVLLQPGQAYRTISIAMGFGRSNAGKVGNNVGGNAFQFGKIRNGSFQYSRSGVEIIKTGRDHPLALTQTHHSMEGRAIVRETTLEKYVNKPSSGNELHEKFKREAVSLYKEPTNIGYHWSLSIDLNACTGCSTCVIACQAENNVPVIGREQVRKRRIMHWIRLDRYYSDSIDNPQVYHQPIMCQHCDNAPCENVCPVAATMHSDDGLNHMTYNRCIGTRYCMNNCPYKVRRFNWFSYYKNKEFDFHMNSNYGRMVLNPDVVVRSRGVAEKCSLCIQRIQEKKTKAKLENRLLADDEIKPACLQACPADAIVFGNRKDKKSEIYKKFEDKRNYGLIEEIHALPSVGYLVKVRNQPSAG